MDYNKEYTKLELESLFANDFSSPVFPILSNIYLKENDLSRARKVCEVGLKFNATNIDGIYMLAKINILTDNITKAEELLKTNFEKELFSIKTIKLLVEVRDALNRSKKETKKIIDTLLKIETDDSFSHQWIHDYEQCNINNKNSNAKHTEITFDISNDIASFTFYNVLKTQKYYNQANIVLNLLQSNNKIDPQIYKQEKQLISKLLHL